METLIEQAKKGDKQAFTNLILEQQQLLYKIAKSRLQNQNDIEDVLQETIIIAYTKIKQLKDNRKFSMWICKILINQCNKWYQAKKIITIPIENMEEILQDNRSINNGSQMEYEEIIQLVDGENKDILLLYYGGGYTTKQISYILNKSENTIKTKLRRTKELLKEKLKGGV